MDNLTTGRGGSSAFKGLAWVAGALATCAALVIGAVLAVFAAATVVVIAIMSSVLLGLAGLAMRARRTARARTNADPDLIEAHKVGGHSWVAYGWNERR
ncbi:hypothetical protein [Caulobacter mirabilis]|uniref:Uncharacterized protein n=1 Tax=Caulobacter mirabilis TaxID=69666 RepID=A0A2D2AW02_9CAUL|nr:hypothetical protein [Caulobacter mirabilis]ATQ42202.1 hypothetical protein CSW64_07120 [Caulobacter mirabilis]